MGGGYLLPPPPSNTAPTHPEQEQLIQNGGHHGMDRGADRGGQGGGRDDYEQHNLVLCNSPVS